jgi:3-oxoacyl-[acyl-carrier protein] reductase
MQKSNIKIDLSDKMVLVTGGTRGIGKAVADKFSEAGASVIATGTKKHEVDKLNKELNNPNIYYYQVDFSDAKSLSFFLEYIKNLPGPDILVNNAGVNKIALNIETVVTDFDYMVDINLKAPYLVARESGKKMIAKKYGRIVNITSIWSEITRPERSIYTTTKAGLAGLTKSLAVEFAEFNILVNAVAPGFTLTELTKQTNTEEELSAIAKKIPVKRMARPEEIASLVLYLCSDLNTYITGQNIIIDGGYTNV